MRGALLLLRRNKNLTQDEVASLAEINVKYYSRIERGKSNPSCQIMQKIATALEVEFDPYGLFTNQETIN